MPSRISISIRCFVGSQGPDRLALSQVESLALCRAGWATPGDRGHQFIDTPYGRLGLLICFDINYEPPKLKENRVDHLLYSIAWVDNAKSDWFTKRLPEIAQKADVNIIGANWSVPDKPGWYGYGQTEIIRRSGEVAAKVKNDLGNEIIYAELAIPKGK